MTVSNIGEARRRRDKIREAAEWAFAELPWTAGTLSDEFVQRWPDMTTGDRIEVGQMVDRMVADHAAPVADLSELLAARARLNGRPEHWRSARDWLLAHGGDAFSREFANAFGHISRSEMLIACLEHGRILALCGGEPR